MTEMFSTLGTWNWLIFGVLLMALELLAPGVFLFWLGLAALLVGLLSFGVHPPWQAQILMFAVFAAAAVPLWRRLARRRAGRAGVHAGEADHRRMGHGADRRYGLAHRRSRHAGWQPGAGCAGGWRRHHRGGGVISFFVLTRFLPANRYPLRSKTLYR